MAGRTAATFGTSAQISLSMAPTEQVTAAMYSSTPQRYDRWQVLNVLLGDRLDKTQLTQLYQKKYKQMKPDQGMVDADIFDVNNQEKMFEVINVFMEHDFALAMQYIDKFIASNGSESITWFMPDSFKYAQQFKHNYEVSRTEPEGTAYDGKCPRKGCRSKTFKRFEIQTSSWDEPAKQKISCLKCGITFQG